jgi:hypothetical protein
MFGTTDEICKLVAKVCANYGRNATEEVTQNFCEAFIKTDFLIFKKSCRFWMDKNNRMPTIADLKKICRDEIKKSQNIALSLSGDAKSPCDFNRFKKPSGYVACEISKKLCCENSFRTSHGNHWLCEFHYETIQEWFEISTRYTNWLGDPLIHWTKARILQYRYQVGDNVEKGRILAELTEPQRNFVLAVEHLIWQSSQPEVKVDISQIFQNLPYDPSKSAIDDRKLGLDAISYAKQSNSMAITR